MQHVLLLLLLFFSKPAAAMSVRSYAASPTQAILSYVAPDNSPCTIEVSESNTYAPLVHDVDPNLFNGANLDSRAGALTSGANRVFLVGARSIQTAADNRKYSRALQQGTLHYYRVTCSGGTVATGTFTTKVLPFGATYQDLLPMNADGTYNYPSYSTTDRNETLIDSQTGVLIRHVNVDADRAPGSVPWPAAGGFGQFCSDTLSPQGNYHCLLTDQSTTYAYLYAINPVTGVVLFLGAAMSNTSFLNPQSFGQFSLANPEVTNFSATDANVMYKGVYLTDVRQYAIAKWTYTGNDNPAAATGTNPPIAPGVTVNMLGGQDLNTLVHAFNPAFDGSKFGCGLVGVQANYGLLSCRRGFQGTYAWEGAYNFGNGLPLGAGGNGGIVAMTQLWANQGTRWCTDHTYEFLGYNAPVYSIAVDYMSAPSYPAWVPGHFYNVNDTVTGSDDEIHIAISSGMSGSIPPNWNNTHNWTTAAGTLGLTFDNSVTWKQYQAPIPGDGPYNVTLQTQLPGFPDPAASPGTVTNITVSSAWDSLNWGTQPSAWSPGEPVSNNPDHFLQTIQPGDMLCIPSPGGNCGEFLKVRAKRGATSWDVERGVLVNQGGIGVVPAHRPGEQITVWCQNVNSINTYSGGYVFWDFLASPDGSNPANYVLNWGNHPVSRLSHRVDSGWPFSITSVTNKSTWGATPQYFTTPHPFFAGVAAAGDGNGTGKHPSMASGDDSTFFDVTYFGGANLYSAPNSSATALVPGTSNVWRYDYTGGAAYPSGVRFAPKTLPIFAKTCSSIDSTQCHSQGLVDVSTPCPAGGCVANMLTDASPDYVWCKPNADNECVMGSRKSEPYIYFKMSTLDQANGRWCGGTENPAPIQDICFGNFPAMMTAGMQFKFVTPNDVTGGSSYRPLTRTFANYNNMAGNLKLTYMGEWALYYFVESYAPLSTRVFALKVPPDPGSDGIDRSTFVPAILNLSPPAGMGIAQAQVKFWYAEQGGSISQPYCTSRREGCVAVSATIDPNNPFSYVTSDSYTPAACASSCVITVPVYPLHTANFSIEYLDAGGKVVTTVPGYAMENVTVLSNDASAPPPPPPADSPVAYIDSLTPGASVTGMTTVSGWALEGINAAGTPIGIVQVKVDGTLVGTATYGIPRADVCAAYPGRPGCPNVGFTYQLNTAALSGGTHTISVVATDTYSTPKSGSHSIDVSVTALPPPVVRIDSPANGDSVSNTVSVGGWAIPAGTAAITAVQIQVDGTTAGPAAYGVSRLDVCAVYPGRTGCPAVGFGYSLSTSSLAPGNHTITAVATDANGVPGSYSIKVNVTAPPPTLVVIDSLLPGATVAGTVAVSGWAIDPLAAIGSVQILVDGTAVGTATYGIPRSDVCVVYPGRPGCPNVGFTYSLNANSLSTGSHTITAVAKSAQYSITVTK